MLERVGSLAVVYVRTFDANLARAILFPRLAAVLFGDCDAMGLIVGLSRFAMSDQPLAA